MDRRQKVMLIDQTIVAKEFTRDFFGNPNMAKGCANATRPFPIDTPQPLSRMHPAM